MKTIICAILKSFVENSVALYYVIDLKLCASDQSDYLKSITVILFLIKDKYGLKNIYIVIEFDLGQSTVFYYYYINVGQLFS